MVQPQSNGLFEVATAKPKKERGFCCMKLIEFLVRDGICTWDDWHGAHQQAAVGACSYKSECPIYERTMANARKKGLQLTLQFTD